MSAVLLAAHSHPTWADFGPTVWICIVLAGAFAMWTVWKAVMFTLRPGEEEPDHIKRQILLEPGGLDVSLSSDTPGVPPPATGDVSSEVTD